MCITTLLMVFMRHRAAYTYSRTICVGFIPGTYTPIYNSLMLFMMEIILHFIAHIRNL